MPGATPREAVEAFLRPLREAIACVSKNGHVQLSKGGWDKTGDTHSWLLDRGKPSPLSGGYGLSASMYYEILDQGASRPRDERYRVKTRAYLYAITAGENELLTAHWHPQGKSHVIWPHWHIGATAISELGVFLKRAHLPSPRISLEHFLRTAVDNFAEIEPLRGDWSEVLERSESLFNEYRNWS